jgi:BirA family transcriptional regulator, biotin operon repressor / biotin---[acetyl-CoA-carboxylase] ligase
MNPAADSGEGAIELGRLRLPAAITRVEYSIEVDSTNDVVRRLAAEIPRVTCVLAVAERQTAGRGRGANRWWTGDGSLAFSLLVDPARYGIEVRYGCMVPLAAATAVVETATRHLPSPAVGIRWPNDVYIGRRKLAGILVEALADGRQIVGIGLNVNNSAAAAPPEVSSIATSLCDEIGGPLDRTEVLSELVTAVDEALARLSDDRPALATLADELCLQRDEVLRVQLGEETVVGRCVGIADDGGLILETSSGRRTMYSGVVLKP